MQPLGLSGVLTPVTALTNEVFAFLPRMLGAGLFWACRTLAPRPTVWGPGVVRLLDPIHGRLPRMFTTACLLAAAWLEPALRVGVARRWRALLLTLAPVVVVFVAWDVAAIAAGHWSYDPAQVVGVTLPGGLPLEELLFFLVVPVCAVLGFEAAEGSPDGVVLRGAWSEERCTADGVLHGGYLMALADSAAATLAFLNLPDGATTSTIEAKTNFVAAVRGGAVTARATIVHKGRTTIVVQTDVTDEAGHLVSRTLQTQAVLQGAG